MFSLPGSGFQILCFKKPWPCFSLLGLKKGQGHTHSGKNYMKHIVHNKTNACYSKNNADGAEAVDVSTEISGLAFGGN